MMSQQKGMGIGTRLGLGFGLVLALMVGITVVGVLKVMFIDHTLTEITDINAVKQRHAINFRGSVHDRAIALRDVVLLDEAGERSASLGEIRRLEARYAEAARAMETLFAGQAGQPEERAILAEIRAIEQRTLPMIRAVIDAREAGRPEQARALLLEQARPGFVQWLASINRFIDWQEHKSQEETASAREVAGEFAWLMVSLCALAIALGASVAFLITRHLVRGLGGEPGEAAAAVRRIASGDLTAQVASQHPDSMLEAVAGMQRHLREMMSEMRAAAGELSTRVGALSHSSREVLQAAEEQAASSTASAASIEEMTVSINEVSQIARLTEEHSARTAELSEQGVTMVRNAADEIARVAETVSVSSERIASLKRRSEEIAGIAGTISSIADQTNLLALNAAIEAARAGDSGRGFAVVAEEVRQLAARTATATADIARMIESIQSETGDAVGAMETAAPQVARGLSLANDAAEGLAQIRNQSLASLDNVRDVARASRQQVLAIDEIASHVERIARMSRDTSRAMESNTQGALALEEIAQGLSRQVERFQV